MRWPTILLALPFLFAPGRPARAQGTQPPADTKAETAKALPPGEVKVLEAVVMEVRGTAQARAGGEGGWSDLKVNDTLKPGTVIRTGRDSYVALRVGMNATVVVERQTRAALPEIVQDGEVLRTRVAMSFGRADVRVDRIGLRNDFEVATPTATLAVRGTASTMTWDSVKGFHTVGVRDNRIRAIELRYLSGVEAYLSGGDQSSDAYQLPALAAFYETYILPLQGAVSSEEGDKGTTGDPSGLETPRRTTGLLAASRDRGTKGSFPDGGGDGGGNGNGDGGGTPPPTTTSRPFRRAGD